MNGVTYIERVDEKTGLIYSIPFVCESAPLSQKTFVALELFKDLNEMLGKKEYKKLNYD